MYVIDTSYLLRPFPNGSTDKRALTVWSLERIKFAERDAFICSERSAILGMCSSVTSGRSANSSECSAKFVRITHFQSVPYGNHQKDC